METDDCRCTYQELTKKGVTFLQEPADRPYGVEAVFRDDSGNWISSTEGLRSFAVGVTGLFCFLPLSHRRPGALSTWRSHVQCAG